jgi:hypothetical protein
LIILVAKKASSLKVIQKLNRILIATTVADQMEHHDFSLILIDFEKTSVTVKNFAKNNLSKAMKEYSKHEEDAKNGAQIDVVLVTGGSINQLRNAYPNYFADTRNFTKLITQIVDAATEELKKA